MAKAGSSNLLEQHVEKAILGLSIVFLLFAVSHWLVSSPEKWEATPTPPESIAEWDNWLLNQALQAETRVSSYKPSQKPIPAYADALAELVKNPMPVAYLAGVDLTLPRMPLVTEITTQQNEPLVLADLAKIVPAPGQPKIVARRMLQQREKLADVNAAIGVSVYPWAELANSWNDKLKNSSVIPSIIVQELLVERQELNPDGTWSSAVPVKLEPVGLVEAAGDHRELSVPVVPALDGKNVDAVHGAMDSLRATEWQQQVMQPSYLPVFWPATHQWVDWKVNLPNNELSNIDGESETPVRPGTAVTPTTPKPVVTPPRPTGTPSGSGNTSPPSGTGRPSAPHQMTQAEELRALAGGGAGPRSPEGNQPPHTPVAPAVRPAGAPPVAPAASVAGVATVKMQTIPPLARQIQLGKVLSWFLDPTMENGKSYRYRVSLKLVNPLLMCVKDVKSPEDAQVATIDGPWSAWSEPVSVSGSADFFLTGSFEANQDATVTIFSTSLGQTVRQPVRVKSGQAIGSKTKVKVSNPVDASAKIETEVDFSTGATVVGLNFNKIIWKGNTSKKTTELLYLDSNGELKTRLLDIDLDSKPYKDLESNK